MGPLVTTYIALSIKATVIEAQHKTVLILFLHITCIVFPLLLSGNTLFQQLVKK